MSYSTCPESKISNFQVFWHFLIFGKIEDGAQNDAILDDVTGPQQCGIP